jgi:hypothetical protein
VNAQEGVIELRRSFTLGPKDFKFSGEGLLWGYGRRRLDRVISS